MKRFIQRLKCPISPLVWLCAASALALTALSALNPGGIYSEYRAALGSGVPGIAAVFTAAQDGVYPWSAAMRPNGAQVDFIPLSGTVTDAEVAASVGDSPIAGFSAPDDFIPLPSPVEDAPEEETARYAEGFVTVDASWFDDALFIGDSHIEGLCDYADLHNATYYFKRGLDIWSVLDKGFVSEDNLTIPEALAEQQFGKIYIMLGINEIATGTTESYAAQYGHVVDELRQLQPDALIFIQAIFHTSQKKSESSVFKNEAINDRNAAISQLADGEHVFFIDNNPVFDDENGALNAEYSGDGVHVKAPYYNMWRDNLFRYGKALNA